MQNTNIKILPVVRPQAIIDDASPVSVAIDSLGARYCIVKVELGATDIAVTALSVSESDTLTDANTLENGVAITGLDFAGSLPSATDDNKIYLFMYPIAGRKRYQDVIFTYGNGSAGGFVSINAILFDNEVHNDNAASFGATTIKRIP